jgi:NitT/TauT family transport system substrate-binding protein
MGAAASTLGVVPAAAQPMQVRLGGTPSDDMVPLVYAQHSGAFTKLGLDVNIAKMSSGSAVTAAVLSGSLDFGKSSLPTLLEAHEKGLPIVLAWPSVLYDARSPYVAFIVAKDGPQNARDFNGTTVAVSSLGDLGTISFLAWMDQHGGDSKSVRFTEVPLSAAAAAVAEKRVAAAESSYPVLGAALASGAVRLLPTLTALAPLFLLAAWFTTADYAAAHPLVVRGLARAWADSARYTNGHHAETVPLMAEFTGIAAETIARNPRAELGIRLNVPQIQPLIDASAKYGAIKRSFAAREIIDPNALLG